MTPTIRWHAESTGMSPLWSAWSVSSAYGTGYGSTLRAAWVSWRVAEARQVLASTTKPRSGAAKHVAIWGG